LIAPVIGPMLDRIQRGRRIALAVSCAGQALLAVMMALHFDDWLLYPAALGTLVLSKSFDVLKAAVTPRLLPSGITLSKTNARLAVFGLAAGAVFGVVGRAVREPVRLAGRVCGSPRCWPSRMPAVPAHPGLGRGDRRGGARVAAGRATQAETASRWAGTSWLACGATDPSA